MDTENFSSIYLVNSELDCLKQAKKMGVVLVYPTPEHLLKLNFITASGNNNNQYHITDAGVRYIEYIQNRKNKETKEQKRKDIQFWSSLVIASLISFSALMVSIIELILK